MREAEAPDEEPKQPELTPEERHAAAVALGRLGGKATTQKLTPEDRREIAKKAAKARWQK